MRSILAIALLAAFGSTPALAGNPLVTITVADETGTTWTEKLGTTTSWGGTAGLLTLDANGNFGMLQGGSQPITTDGIDYWAWNDTGAYWSWHSADTDSSGNYLAQMELHAISGKGDPEVSYSLVLKNTTGRKQTASFTVDQTIVPPLGGANTVYASVTGDVTSTTGLKASQSQALVLYAGPAMQNAGVDLAVTDATGHYFSELDKSGPMADWDYMTLSTTVTLSGGKGTVALAGYGSITAVPEADSYAMLLAGLGIVGFIARRRRVL